MPPVGFEPIVSVGVRPQTYALDRVANGTGHKAFYGFNLLNHTGYLMHHHFNIQQLYALPHAVFMCFVFI